MISCVAYDTVKSEREKLGKVIRDEAAYASEDEWKIHLFGMKREWEEWLEKESLLDVTCLDLADETVRENLAEFRRRYPETLLLVIADAGISPMSYLRPAVMPNSLLMRPAGEEQIRSVIRELFQFLMEGQEKDEKDDCFVADTRDGKTFIPYAKIEFFEAREKKVFLRCGAVEYAIYDTLENVLTGLPEDFLRCHRSYIVNKRKIRRVMLSKNLLEMTDGAEIPVSRSYRTEVRNL